MFIIVGTYHKAYNTEDEAMTAMKERFSKGTKQSLFVAELKQGLKPLVKETDITEASLDEFKKPCDCEDYD